MTDCLGARQQRRRDALGLYAMTVAVLSLRLKTMQCEHLVGKSLREWDNKDNKLLSKTIISMRCRRPLPMNGCTIHS